MPAKAAKEAPLTPALRARVEALTARSAADVTVDEWRELGNDCVGNGSFLTAIRCYTHALQRDGGGDSDRCRASGDASGNSSSNSISSSSGSSSNSAPSTTAVLYSNRSAAYVQSSMLTGATLALHDAERAVALAPQWHKAHVRVGDAQRARHKLDEAAAAYERALALDSACASARAALRELRTAMYVRDLERREQQRQRGEEEVACGTNAATAGDDDDKDNAVHRTPTSSSSLRRPPREQQGSDGSHIDDNHNNNDNNSSTRYEFHNAPFDDADDIDTSTRLRRRAPTSDETAQLIATWSQDTCVRADRTAMKPRGVSLEEATHGAGLAYKDALMHRFRDKLRSDTALSARVHERHTQQLLRGEAVDYRNGEQLRTQYAHATNAIGLGITTDAYKDYVGSDRKW